MLLYALAIPRISSGDLTETRATHPSSDPAPTQTAESDRTYCKGIQLLWGWIQSRIYCWVGYRCNFLWGWIQSTAESDTATTSCGFDTIYCWVGYRYNFLWGWIQYTAESDTATTFCGVGYNLVHNLLQGCTKLNSELETTYGRVASSLLYGCCTKLNEGLYCRVGYNLLLQGWIQPTTAGLDTAYCRVGNSQLQGWIQPTAGLDTTYYSVPYNLLQGWMQRNAGLDTTCGRVEIKRLVRVNFLLSPVL